MNQSQQIQLNDLVEGTVELPTMPVMLAQLNKVAADPNSTPADLAAVVARDPAVAANVLRIVNSSYYGLPGQVGSLEIAASIVGGNMLKKIALRAGLQSTFAPGRERIPHFDLEAFWSHAMYVGVASQVLGTASPVAIEASSDDLHAAGLMHEIGKLVLLESCRGAYLAVLQLASRSALPEAEVEQHLLGFTHGEVGAALIAKWQLPWDMGIGIRYHHRPSRDPSQGPLSAILHLADQLAWNSGRPSTIGPPKPRLDPEAHARTKLLPEQVDALVPAIEDEFRRLRTP
ncbi:MAG: hypothetical protein RL148_1507 [Planctomycetota bacterium]|jgi:HD-like signal output (HDOD) protein